MADNVTQVDGRGVFKGSDEQLCNSIDALLDLNAKGAVSHRVPGMAVTLLEAAADRIAATRPAPKADSALVGELREKAEQADAAKRNLHGLPVLAMESDTHKGKLALWCDNGLAGVGQACVAVNLGEFPDEQIKAIAALANIAATTDFATILAALSDRDVVLEEARAALEPFGNPDLLMQIADDDDEEWAKFRLLCSDYRRAGRSLARLDAALQGGSK